ncbi:MAG: prephenate dehydratase [Candidatus Poribacteria bacterium]|nr:prephenate dehydratase [Candidatus Poribacteria bacterium]
MELENLRDQLDEIDNRILLLLHNRAEIVRSVGQLKSANGGENVYVPHRETKILARLREKNRNFFPADALDTIFAEIISACRSLEQRLEVAFLGPEGSFGHAAALRHFGSSVNFNPIADQTDVFSEVESGRADYGVVAIENSSRGTVRDVLEMFAGTTLQICAEVILPIDQNLLSKSPKERITKVYSHPQPFAQCREWLRQNLKGIRQIEVASTSEAAQLAAAEEDAAAIASKLAAEIYGLQIVGESIMDSSCNITRFLVIGPHTAMRSGQDRTSIFIAIQDRVGALYQVLTVLQKHQINMSKIESMPAQTKPWEYVFFVDLDGHVDDSNVQAALPELEKLCLHVKLLGSYARSASPQDSSI